jgi:16S rRNA C967 or C1407 C5-methylase (RsmB/RsmF family)
VKGAVEVRDEGSQLPAVLGSKARRAGIDLCAGASGKAAAAMMGGKGQLIAADRDKRQLARSTSGCRVPACTIAMCGRRRGAPRRSPTSRQRPTSC